MENNEDFSDDKLNWSTKEEEKLIQIMVAEIRKGSLSSSTFHKRIWSKIDEQMTEHFKKKYTVVKLKQKYNRFRQKWKLFKELIESTGFGWDPLTNTVEATKDNWAKRIAENKDYKQFRKTGCDHYELLSEIFFETVAIGKLARSSTQGPLNSEEEQEVEEVFLHGTASSAPFPTTNNELDDDIEETYTSHTIKKNKKRKSHAKSYAASGSKSRVTDFPIIDEAWGAFRDAQLSKKMLYEKAVGPSEEEECVDILEGMEDITPEQYMKSLDKLADSSFRLMFIRMSDISRRQWLQSLAP